MGRTPTRYSIPTTTLHHKVTGPAFPGYEFARFPIRTQEISRSYPADDPTLCVSFVLSSPLFRCHIFPDSTVLASPPATNDPCPVSPLPTPLEQTTGVMHVVRPEEEEIPGEVRKEGHCSEEDDSDSDLRSRPPGRDTRDYPNPRTFSTAPSSNDFANPTPPHSNWKSIGC